MNLNNNTILITGGGSGIGLALANELLRLGNKIIICSRNLEKLRFIKSKIPAIEIIQCDISDEDSVAALVSNVLHRYPDLNFLINNAGVMKMWNIQRGTSDVKLQKAEVLTNLFGTAQLTQLLIPHLLKQKNSVVLNVSSALALVPMSAAPIYSATKAALHSYSISLRQQLEGTNIKVFEVLPAAIKTEMATELEKTEGIENRGPKMSPEKLAMLTVNGLRKDRFEIRPGMANILYIVHRLFPSLAQKMISDQSKKILYKLNKTNETDNRQR